MMIKGNVNGALKLLTENISNGILPLNDRTLKMLKQKHAEANEPLQEVLMQEPTRPVHPIVYEDMDHKKVKVHRRCSVEKLFLKIMQNLLENACSSYLGRPSTFYLKGDTRQVFYFE